MKTITETDESELYYSLEQLRASSIADYYTKVRSQTHRQTAQMAYFPSIR